MESKDKKRRDEEELFCSSPKIENHYHFHGGNEDSSTYLRKILERLERVEEALNINSDQEGEDGQKKTKNKVINSSPFYDTGKTDHDNEQGSKSPKRNYPVSTHEEKEEATKCRLELVGKMVRFPATEVSVASLRQFVQDNSFKFPKLATLYEQGKDGLVFKLVIGGWIAPRLLARTGHTDDGAPAFTLTEAGIIRGEKLLSQNKGANSYFAKK